MISTLVLYTCFVIHYGLFMESHRYFLTLLSFELSLALQLHVRGYIDIVSVFHKLLKYFCEVRGLVLIVLMLIEFLPTHMQTLVTVFLTQMQILMMRITQIIVVSLAMYCIYVKCNHQTKSFLRLCDRL